ncbi:MAG: hypothetical protein OHK0029_13480 [Armatimonadaceae bacterium]
MDTVETYRAIIHHLLSEYQHFFSVNTKTDVETEVIRDDMGGQYLLMRVGWRGDKRVRRPLFYLRLKNGKIWIEEDNTQEGIANDLRRAGVPEQDIVLAFTPPDLRHLTEFAVG